MRWNAISYYQPFISPKKRLALGVGIILMAGVMCLGEFLQEGLTASFYLFGGFALVATIFEWKHYHKPQEISLLLEDGKLVFKNHYSGEKHTVYQSRTHRIKYEKETLVFYGESSIATRIPLRNFPREKVEELRKIIHSWNKQIVDNGNK